MKNNHLENSIPNGLDHLSHAQRERLAYIEFRLYFLGEARRQDLIQRFGIAPAVATRDFAQYRDSFPENINFDNKTKRYVLGDGFSAAFRHVSERVLTALSQGFGEGGSSMGALLTCELPLTLNNPSVDILAPVTRAIHNKKVVRMEYKSFTSGATVREINPFALVNDGLRWHVRAYDRKSTEFRDFVLTRMLATTLVDNSPIENHELAAADIQWNRIVELDLVPHPNQEYSQIIEGDYAMIAGVLRINVRAATAGYVLRHWLVDCSPNHRLKGNEYRLWLRNHLALYNVSSAVFAPGYEAPL